MNFRLKHIVILLLLVLSGQTLTAQTEESAGQDSPVILYSGTPKRYEIADIVVTGLEENNPKTLI